MRATLDAFGPFKALFEADPRPLPGYLSLLHAADADAAIAVRQLVDAASQCGDGLDESLRPLFDSLNWRPQLVAASTLVVTGSIGVCVQPLWSALDRLGWASPQLAAAASVADPSFVENARKRMERLCRPSTGMADDRSAKLMATLVALCEPLRETDRWREQLLIAADVQGVLARDIHGSAAIALNWLKNLRVLARDAVR